MASLRLLAGALDDIERLVAFLDRDDPAAAAATAELNLHGLQILEAHPLVGRVVEDGRRELIISRGRSGYIALYRFVPRHDRLDVLAIRHQREAGFEEDQ